MNISYTKKRETRFAWALLVAMTLLVMFSLGSCDDNDEEQNPPAITNVNPASAPVGTAITLTGTNFMEGATVKFGTTEATVSSVTSTQLVTAVPAGLAVGATAIAITVGEKTSSPVSFEVLAEPIPLIIAIAPARALRGTQVIINGTNFTAAATVKFGTQTATVTAATATQITTSVPASVPVGNTTVTVSVANRSSNAFAFEVLADPPTLSGFTPLQGIVGTSVTLTGQNFSDTDADNVVKFGTVTATVTSATPTQIVVTVPSGLTSGSVAVSVTVNGQSVTASQQFTFIIPEISVKSLYFAQLDGTAQPDIFRGYKNSNGQLVQQKLYDAEPDATVSGIALRKNTNEIYWVEQSLDFATFATVSKVFKGDTTAMATATNTFTIDGAVGSIAIDGVGNKLYYVNVDNTTSVAGVWASDLNGANQIQLFTTSTYSSLTTLAIDVQNGFVYFVDQFDPGGASADPQTIIYKGNINGTGTPVAVYDEDDTSTPASTNIIGIAVHGTSLFVGSASSASSEILKGNLNGTAALQQLYKSAITGVDPMKELLGLTVDSKTGYLYWINKGSGTATGNIFRANGAAVSQPEKLFDMLTLPIGSSSLGRSKKKGSYMYAIQ